MRDDEEDASLPCASWVLDTSNGDLNLHVLDDDLFDLDGDSASVDIDIGALVTWSGANTTARDLIFHDRKGHGDNDEATDLNGALRGEHQDVLGDA